MYQMCQYKTGPWVLQESGLLAGEPPGAVTAIGILRNSQATIIGDIFYGGWSLSFRPAFA